MSARLTLDAIGRIVQDDPLATVGMVVDLAQVPLPRFLLAIRSRHWQEAARVAHSAGRQLIAAGRPWCHDGQGIFLFVPAGGRVAKLVEIAHRRMRDAGSTQTAWIIVAHAAVRQETEATLAQLVLSEGTA